MYLLQGFWTSQPRPLSISFGCRFGTTAEYRHFGLSAPDSVRIYDSFARPQEEDRNDSGNHLLEELRRIGSRLHGIEKLSQEQVRHRRFSGNLAEDEISSRVSALIPHFSAICSILKRALESAGLDADIAQALLGRAIFVKYLEDRRILKPAHFQPYGNHQNFREVLDDITNTYEFFDWLRNYL